MRKLRAWKFFAAALVMMMIIAATAPTHVVNMPVIADDVTNRDLFVSSHVSSKVVRYSGTTGEPIGDFVTSGLSNPYGLVFGPDGNLYVSSWSDSKVVRYNGTTGDFMDNFVEAGLNGPVGLVFGPDGNLYVSSSGNHKVVRYNGTTGEIIGDFVTAGLSGPLGLVFGSDGNLYVSSSANDKVVRYNGTTGALIGDFTASGSGLDQPFGLAFGPGGDLYVCSSRTNNVLRYNGTTGDFISIFAYDWLNLPEDLAFGPDGDLYVCNTNSGQVLRYNGTTGEYICIFVAAGSGGLDKPTGLTFRYQVSTGKATSIMATTAILHGNLIYTGGLETKVHICGGLTDNGTAPAKWDHNYDLGIRPAGAFSLGVTGLIPNTTYYYRCYGENATGGIYWSPSSSSFTTQADLGLWRNYWAGPGKDWFWFSSGRP